MSLSSMMQDFREAGKEHIRTVVHPDGRKTIYVTDAMGREHYTLISRRGSFQGTFKIERGRAPDVRNG